MKRGLFSLVVAIAILALVVAPAAAVQYGQPDGNGHPYVGLVVFFDSNKVPLWRCTGTLLSETVFLTAGHCTGIDPALGFGPTSAAIWFDPGPIPVGDWAGPGTTCTGHTGYPCTGDASGTPHPHPGWNGFLTLPNTHDIGVVVLDAPHPMASYGTVAPVGFLDSLASKRGQQDTSFTVVGYGLQSVKPVEVGLRQRFVGTVTIVDLVSALTDGYNARFSSDPGQGNGPGGTCFGDSGGPVFAGTSNVIVAVNSFVLNLNCKGSGYGFRTDTQLSADFLSGFLP
jgi:trypsin